MADDIEQQADAAVAEMASAYATAASSFSAAPSFVKKAEDLALGVLTLGLYTAAQEVGEAVDQGVDQTAYSNYLEIGKRIETWRTDLRQQARNGQNENGGPYTWEDWFSFRDGLASDLGFAASVALKWDPVSVGIGVAADTAHNLAHPIDTAKKFAQLPEVKHALDEFWNEIKEPLGIAVGVAVIGAIVWFSWPLMLKKAVG